MEVYERYLCRPQCKDVPYLTEKGCGSMNRQFDDIAFWLANIAACVIVGLGLLLISTILAGLLIGVIFLMIEIVASPWPAMALPFIVVLFIIGVYFLSQWFNRLMERA